MEGPALAPTEAPRSWQQACVSGIPPSAPVSGPPRLGETLLAPRAHLPPLHGPSHLQQPSREAGITITPEVDQKEVLSLDQPHTAIQDRAGRRTKTFRVYVLAAVHNS